MIYLQIHYLSKRGRLNEISRIKGIVERISHPLTGMSPTLALVLPVVLAVSAGIPGVSLPTLTLLCCYTRGLTGVTSPYATGSAPMYCGSGSIGKRDFWKLGLIFAVIYFAGLLGIVHPWLKMIR